MNRQAIASPTGSLQVTAVDVADKDQRPEAPNPPSSTPAGASTSISQARGRATSLPGAHADASTPSTTAVDL
jgi:hypothetical protein